ncbi:unnamed protein product [Lampetra planeri]
MAPKIKDVKQAKHRACTASGSYAASTRNDLPGQSPMNTVDLVRPTDALFENIARRESSKNELLKFALRRNGIEQV